MHCDHCVRRYERESVAVEAVYVVSLNYGERDTATRNCATEWSLRVTATQLLKKKATWEYSLLTPTPFSISKIRANNKSTVLFFEFSIIILFVFDTDGY